MFVYHICATASFSRALKNTRNEKKNCICSSKYLLNTLLIRVPLCSFFAKIAPTYTHHTTHSQIPPCVVPDLSRCCSFAYTKTCGVKTNVTCGKYPRTQDYKTEKLIKSVCYKIWNEKAARPREFLCIQGPPCEYVCHRFTLEQYDISQCFSSLFSARSCLLCIHWKKLRQLVTYYETTGPKKTI